MADDMFNHRPGQVEVATDAYLIARDIEDLDGRITRTEEWLCSQVLFAGRCEILDWDADRHLATLEYDPVIETFVAVPWGDPTSRPLDDLKSLYSSYFLSQ
jgi:hypothetical protein